MPPRSVQKSGRSRSAPSASIQSASTPSARRVGGNALRLGLRARRTRRPAPRLRPTAASRSRRPAGRRARASPTRAPAAPPAASRQRLDVAAAARRCGRSGWRRIVPLAEQGASSRIASNGARRAPSAARPRRRRAPRGGCAPGSPRAGASRGTRHVERGHLSSGRGELQRLAAGRGAEVEHAQAADLAEQARGQRGAGVLHPPGALGEAGQRRDLRPGAARRSPPVGSTSAASACGPVRGRRRIAQRQVERRRPQVRVADRRRRRGAPGGAHRAVEPVGQTRLAAQRPRPRALRRRGGRPRSPGPRDAAPWDARARAGPRRPPPRAAARRRDKARPSRAAARGAPRAAASCADAARAPRRSGRGGAARRRRG